MTYPKEFPPEARAAVEAEMILGRRNYSKVKQASDNARSVRAWILSVFLVYGRQAIDLGTQRVWTVDKVLAEALEGLRLITIEVAHQTGFEYWVENWDGSVKSDVMSEFEATAEWQQFDDGLLALADSTPRGVQRYAPKKLAVPVKTETDVVPLGDNQMHEPRFPDRAAWLNERLRERSWNKHDVSRQGGPDRKTVQKILDGEHVREDVLERVAAALSKAPRSKNLPPITMLDIPQS